MSEAEWTMVIGILVFVLTVELGIIAAVIYRTSGDVVQPYDVNPYVDQPPTIIDAMADYERGPRHE